MPFSFLVQSLFPETFHCSIETQGLGDPEVYPRPEGEVYVTGYPDGPIVVKETPGQEEVRAEVTDRLEGAMKLVSSELGSAEVGVNRRLSANHHAPPNALVQFRRLQTVCCEEFIEVMRPRGSLTPLPHTQITKRQSCHLPVTADGAPIMGKIPQYEGAYVGESLCCPFMHV